MSLSNRFNRDSTFCYKPYTPLHDLSEGFDAFGVIDSDKIRPNKKVVGLDRTKIPKHLEVFDVDAWIDEINNEKE